MPGVADRWKTSPDGLTYTFHLRDGVKWSNGDPLTAGDFVYSFRRILSPPLASEYSYMLYFIRNAEAYNEGKIRDFDEVGAKAGILCQPVHESQLRHTHCPVAVARRQIPSSFQSGRLLAPDRAPFRGNRQSRKRYPAQRLLTARRCRDGPLV